jgi:sec-independent protein translocase protein TatB
MLDFSMGEIGIIAAVALVVLGPDKLPAVAKTAGTLMGKAQRLVTQVKSDIDREVELSELKKIQEDARKMAADIESDLKSSQNALQKEVDSVNDSVKKLSGEIQSTVDTAKAETQTASAAPQAQTETPAAEAAEAVKPRTETDEIRDAWAAATAPKESDAKETASVAEESFGWGPPVETVDTSDLDSAFNWSLNPEEPAEAETNDEPEKSAADADPNTPTIQDLMREIEELRQAIGQTPVAPGQYFHYPRASRVNEPSRQEAADDVLLRPLYANPHLSRREAVNIIRKRSCYSRASRVNSPRINR